jgi:DNA repair protein SbcD/Mre11
MRRRILHVADVHLGNQQYGLDERFNDFGRAFFAVVDYALKERVDVVIIAGDLFHKHAIDPLTLIQAVTGLGKLQDAGIPVVAVEGNHDRASYHDVHSWLHFLASQKHLILLSPTFEEAGVSFAPWNGRTGGYVEVGELRIYGIPYLGAALPKVLAGLGAWFVSAVERPAYAVLAMHAGLEGVVPHASGTVSMEQLQPIRPHVDYVAMGHLHKSFLRGDWLYNPGSLETCGTDEAAWVRGVYDVRIDTDQTPAHTATLVPIPRRAFHLLRFAVDGHDTPGALYDAVGAFLSANPCPPGPDGRPPIVDLVLHGRLGFDRMALDLAFLEERLTEAYSPLHARVRNEATATGVAVTSEGSSARAELEHQVLVDLFSRDARFRAQADLWALAAAEVKDLVLAGASPVTVVDRIRLHRDGAVIQAADANRATEARPVAQEASSC